MYATLEQARAAGATGTDLEVLAALAAARVLIDGYTGQWWESTPATIVTRAGADGLALLPFRVIAVTAVRLVGAVPGSDPLPAGGYLVTSSSVYGQFDSVRLGAGNSWADPLVVGAEPWNGGYAGLYGRTSFDQITVEGTFGRDPTPAYITDAAAALAASRTNGGSIVAGGSPTPPTVDDEGNAVSITIDATTPTLRTRTTGNDMVDAALAPYVATTVRFS